MRTANAQEIIAGSLDAEYRDWTDSTGKFKIRAKLYSFDRKQVEIQKEDGKVVKLPLLKLSSDCKSYVIKAAIGMKDENPFAGGATPAPLSPLVKKEKSQPAKKVIAGGNRTLPLSAPNYNANELVLADNGWNLKADASTPRKNGKRIVGLKRPVTAEKYYSSSFKHASLAVGNKFAAVAIEPSSSDLTTIQIADMESSKVVSMFNVAVKRCDWATVSPDGSKVATFEGDYSTKSIDIWNTKAPYQHLVSWGISKMDEFDPKVALFLDNDSLLTVGKQFVLWNTRDSTPVYSYKLKYDAKVSFSANKKQAAVNLGNDVYIIECLSGDVLGKFTPDARVSWTAFSPDGQFLAFDANRSAIGVWNLKDNKLEQSFPTRISYVTETPSWIGDKYLMTRGSLIDLELQCTVWRYSITSHRAPLLDGQDGRHWVASEKRIVPVSIPSKSLEELTANIDPESLLVLKPGTDVSLELDLPFPPAQQNKIRDRLTAMLAKHECSVVPNAETKLIASVSPGKEKTESYGSSPGRSRFPGMGVSGLLGRRQSMPVQEVEKVTFTPSTAKLNLLKNEKSVWAQTRDYGPTSGMRKQEDKSIQQTVKEMCVPKPDFFMAAAIPVGMRQLPEGRPLGASRISEDGETSD